MRTRILIFMILICTQVSSAQTDSLVKSSKGKILVDGFAKLTYFEKQSDKDEDRFVVKVQGSKPIELTKSGFESSGKKLLADYFGDNINLSQNILNNDLRFQDLEKIVKDYNEWRRSIDRMTNEVK